MKNPMKMSAAGIAVLTKKFEGLKLCVYPDPATGGKPWTGGYGHTGPDVEPGMKVSQALANAWLASDLSRAEAEVNRLVTQQITQHEFDALVDFEYNTGKLAGSTLLAKINAGSFDAALRQFGRWTQAHGETLAGLVKRRTAEAGWFATPDQVGEA